MRFKDLTELFEDMHRHVSRTGDSVIPADNPNVMPPLLGWTAVRCGPGGEILDPSVPGSWTISLGDAKGSRFPGLGSARDRREVTEEILSRHCARCHVYVPPGSEHGDGECALREVMAE